MKTNGTGRIHYARLEGSDRLKRLMLHLGDEQWHSTRDIDHGANICAVSTAIDELRCNLAREDLPDEFCHLRGWEIQTRQLARNRWQYRLARKLDVGAVEGA